MRRGVVIKTVINGFTFDGATKDPMQKAVRHALIAFMTALGQEQAEPTKLAQRVGIRKPSYRRRQFELARALLGQERVSVGTVSKETGLTRQGGNGMLQMTKENFARLLRGLTIAVGNRKNRILLYQFLAAEIRALHCSYGLGDGESYKRALTFLQNSERFTLRSLVRKSAKHHAELTVDHAKRVFSRAVKKLDTSQGHDPTLQVMTVYLLSEETLQAIVNLVPGHDHGT